MPTTVVKTIGQTSSPTVPDYSSLAAWMAACPADLVAANEIWDGQCLDQGTFTGRVSITGITVDATRYIVLECASGASFNQKAGVRTTALNYNESNGVSVNPSGLNPAAINIGTQYTQIIGLQVRDSGSYGGQGAINMGAANTLVDKCIIYTSQNNAPLPQQSTSAVCKNTLIQYGGTTGRIAAHFGQLLDCTLIAYNGSSSYAIESEYGVSLVKDCAVFGFATFSNSVTAAGSDYNATDLGSASTGSHNQTSLTFSAQFVNSASDWRAASSGSGLANNGTPISGITVDISNTTRSVSTPTIGCWELSGSPPPAGSYVFIGNFF